MRNIKNSRYMLFVLILAFSSCDFDSGSNGDPDNGTDHPDIIPPYVYNPPVETFDDVDKPSFDKITYSSGGVDHTYKLMVPWNYDKPQNSSRKYPIVICLHGITNDPNAYYAPVIAGKTEQMKQYPAFLIAPSNTNKGWGSAASWVRTVVANLISNYRIDTNMIYVIGYSMGGSGSYPFVEGLYDEQNYIAAGIVRLSGQSAPGINRNAITEKISIWYNIGLTDTAKRVQIAEQAYVYMRDHISSAGAYRYTKNDSVTSGGNNYSRKTKVLWKDGVEFFKKSEYTGVGHSASVPFYDPGVIEWLFNQSLINR